MLNPVLQKILDAETSRQQNTLDLIASENFTSAAVREAVGSVFMHKYSEGYPGARYYEGNENIDELENLCIEMVTKVFNLPSNWSANVQPLAGSNANLAVYNAILNPGDKILSMYLPDGGHLSHGWSYTPTKDRSDKDIQDLASDKPYYGGSTKISIVSKIFNVVQYKVAKDTSILDYSAIEQLAMQEKPKLIITGGTAYPREIDYKKMREIADKVGAYYLADIAHEAGLIAAGVLTSPIDIADVVTFTTHKTLRGPKGAVIAAKQDIIKLINKSIMPGLQGGPHNGTIAGITQALFEADTPEFKEYAAQVVENAKTLVGKLSELGYSLVSGGTDKHLILIDLVAKNLGGKFASYALNSAGIVTNKSTIPYESQSPVNPSGIRLGTPSVTTRGLKEAEMIKLADLIDSVIKEAATLPLDDFEFFKQQIDSSQAIKEVKEKVQQLCSQFPFKV